MRSSKPRPRCCRLPRRHARRASAWYCPPCSMAQLAAACVALSCRGSSLSAALLCLHCHPSSIRYPLRLPPSGFNFSLSARLLNGRVTERVHCAACGQWEKMFTATAWDCQCGVACKARKRNSKNNNDSSRPAHWEIQQQRLWTAGYLFYAKALSSSPVARRMSTEKSSIEICPKLSTWRLCRQGVVWGEKP